LGLSNPLGLNSWRAHGAKQRAITFSFECLDRFLWQGNTTFLERLPAGFVMREGEFQAERGWKRFQDATTSGNNFAANTIAWDEA
jgi:hypothetical protein